MTRLAYLTGYTAGLTVRASCLALGLAAFGIGAAAGVVVGVARQVLA